LEIQIKVDRDNGVEWETVRKILGWQPRATLRNPPLKITESQFLQIEDELRRLVGNFTEELRSAFDEREEAIQDYCEKWGIEGGKTIKTHVAHERDRNLVIEAKSEFIRKRGRLFCEICNLSLEDRYGNLGKNIVDIHHVIPVSQLETKTQVKISDLIPVCPNCHRIIHSKRPFLSVDEVRKSLRK
jgi:predicted HNH restriction endonuclease